MAFLRALSFLAVLAPAHRLASQCAVAVVAGDGLPGTNWTVNCVAPWDPDGAGPLPERLVAGGGFSRAGRAFADRLGTWDPASRSWTGLPTGLGGSSDILCVLPLANGQLIAAGNFAAIGGVNTFNIARWDGTAWNGLGSGVGGFGDRVHAVVRLANGDLVAAGSFSSAGGVPASRVARWNGVAWSALGAGVSSTVRALAVTPGGDLFAGGTFTSAGGVTVGNLARWNGAGWSAVGAAAIGAVEALAVTAGGELIAAGAFTSIGGIAASRIARWNGSSWSTLGAGVGGTVYSVLPTGNGGLVVGGAFTTAGGQPAQRVARWNGSGWTTLGTGAGGSVRSLAELGSGLLVAGGDFTTVGTSAAAHVAAWNGTAWQRSSDGFDDAALVATVATDGSLLVGGDFRSAGGADANRIARFDGATWQSLGAGFSGTFDQVRAILALPTGGAVVGGAFTSAGGVPANRIAQWNGTAWSSLGTGLSGQVNAIARHPNGSLFVGGSFASAGGTAAANVARWNGASWSALGSGVNGIVSAVIVLTSGDVVVCGMFSQAGGTPATNIARWNGTTWQALGAGLGGPSGLFGSSLQDVVQAPNGDIYAVGSFSASGSSSIDNVARWNGSTWSPLGPGLVDMSTIGTNVTSVVVLADGSVLAGGDFTHAGPVPVAGLARWHGGVWQQFASPVPFGVRDLAVTPSGEVAVVGEFDTFAGNSLARFVSVGSTCSASAVPIGQGCTGSGGPNLLAAVTLPWAGSVFRSRATGMPTLGVALSVLGLQQVAIPLASVLPQGTATCQLLASPDRIDPVLLNAGVADVTIPVAASPALIGQIVLHQVAALEFDFQSNLIAVTTTNASRLTIGTY